MTGGVDPSQGRGRLASLVQHLLEVDLRDARFQAFVHQMDSRVDVSRTRFMDYDERSVRIFLKGYPGQFVSARVISRRLGGRQRYYQDPLWVMPILTKLVDKGFVETDEQGHFRLKKLDPAATPQRTWVSPQVRRILERSSKDFTKVYEIDVDEDELE